MASLKTIEVGRIDPDPDQPREHFDEAELRELAASLASRGQLTPITVRYVRASRRYIIVAGERRWRAAQIAQIRELHALIVDLDNPDDILAAQIAENLGRADMTPSEEAKAFKRLADAGWEVEKIAEASGKSAAYVGYRIDLLQLIGPAREALDKGHLPIGTAWYVSKLSTDAQQRFLRKFVRGDFATPRDAEMFAQACRDNEREDAEQTTLIQLETLSEEEREKFEKKRSRVTARFDRLAGAGEVLAEIAAADPNELAQLLAALPGGVDAYKLRVDHLKQVAGKAAATLLKAKAIAAALSVDEPETPEGQLPVEVPAQPAPAESGAEATV